MGDRGERKEGGGKRVGEEGEREEWEKGNMKRREETGWETKAK